jgi:hypothetical protein
MYHAIRVNHTEIRCRSVVFIPTAGCVDTELPLGRCDYARSDKSIGESACLHHAMWVDHTETCCSYPQHVDQPAPTTSPQEGESAKNSDAASAGRGFEK